MIKVENGFLEVKGEPLEIFADYVALLFGTCKDSRLRKIHIDAMEQFTRFMENKQNNEN